MPGTAEEVCKLALTPSDRTRARVLHIAILRNSLSALVNTWCLFLTLFVDQLSSPVQADQSSSAVA